MYFATPYTIQRHTTMKRITAVLSILLVLSLFTSAPTLAQQPDQRGMMARPDTMPGMMQDNMMGQGMMQGGMMQMMQGMRQQMMQNPMHRANMMAFMLPALADTLGLSDEQANRLDQLKSEAMAQRQEQHEQMATRRQELMSLFEGEEQPDPAAVRQHLMAMAEQRTEQQAALYETAQAMREVLTDEQRQMLNGMTPQEQMHQMMAKIPMREMMQMMRSMQGGMMGGGMMPQGNMQQNMPRRPNRPNR